MIETWLTITTDPAEVEAARKAAAATAPKRYEQVFRRLGERRPFDDEALELIEDKRSDSIGRLTDALEMHVITDEAVGATLLLCRLTEAAGRSYAARILREGATQQRLQVLHGTDGELNDTNLKKHAKFLFEDPQFVEAALAQLENQNKELGEAAARFCGSVGVPEANERFLSLVRKANAPNKKPLLYQLAKRQVTEELLDLALKLWADSGPYDFFGAATFNTAADSESESIRSKVRVQLRAWLESSPDEEWAISSSGWLLLSAVSKAADKDDGDWLLRLIDSKRGFYPEKPLTAYVRLFPDDGRRRLIERFDYKWGCEAAINAAATCYAGTADAEVIRELTTRIDTVDARILPKLCNTLLVIGGKSVWDTIERVANRIDPVELAWWRLRLDPTTYEEIAEALRVSGALSATEIELALDKLSRTSDEMDEGDEAVATLFDFFEAAGSTLYYPVEAVRPPCHHDAIVRRFARGSRGRFRPEAVLEIQHQCDPDDSDAPSTLQFVVKDRLYRAELRNLGDWYDTERLVQMINESLALDEIDERFTALASIDPFVSLVFANPKQLASLAEKFPMALCNDIGAAMRKGLGLEE